MQPQLAGIVDELQHAATRLESLAGSVPDERWTTRKNPDRWSPGECIVHLNLTSAAYIPRLRVAIAEARQLGAVDSAQYSRDKAGWFLSAMIGPLPSLGGFRFGRVRTPASFVPSGDSPKQFVIAEFKRYQDELIAMVREGDGLPVDKVWIRSPFGERMRYTCYSAFVILPRHQERHLDQAEEAR